MAQKAPESLGFRGFLLVFWSFGLAMRSGGPSAQTKPAEGGRRAERPASREA